MAEPLGSSDEERSLARRSTSDLEAPRGDQTSPVTPLMKVALFAGATVFALGTLVQLMVLAWLAIGAIITAVAGSILVRTGGLEPKTFATCVKTAIALDVVLLVAIALASVARRVVQSEAPGTVGPYLRHPVMRTAAGLLIALGVVTAAGWKPSVYFPYPLATIVVLANAYFFALLTLLYTGKVVDGIWTPLKSWAQETPYRTGCLTATLILLGLTGFALKKIHVAHTAVQRLAAEIELERPPAVEGFVDAQLAALCIAAAETAPELARGAKAPGCNFLGSSGESRRMGVLGSGAGSSSGSDCFTALEPEVSAARAILGRDFRFGPYDAEDIAMEALLKTCFARSVA